MTVDDTVWQALSRIPLFAGVERTAVEATRLGGLTNRNYRIDAPSGRYVLRLAGEGTDDYIDREAEAHNARVAARAGVNAEVVFFDSADGTQLSRYVDGVTQTPETFRDLGCVARAGVAFRRLHQCGEAFASDFNLFQKIDEYMALLQKLAAPLPPGYEEVRAEAAAVREALRLHPLPTAPCHCDPLAENFIDTGERMVIIDYEYAGNNDPMWDLGDLSVEAGFDDDQDAALLHAYFGDRPPAFAVGRMVAYKAMCDLLWTLWGVIQHANDNPAEDFWAYAVGRLERCRALMARPDFGRHLAAIAAGP